MPNPLRLAVIANHHFGERPAAVPARLAAAARPAARGSDRTAARLPAHLPGGGTAGSDRARHLTTTRPGRKTSNDHHHFGHKRRSARSGADGLGSRRWPGSGSSAGWIALFASPGGGEAGETPREVVAYAASHESWILAMAFFGLAVIRSEECSSPLCTARLRGIATATESTLVLIGGIAFTLSFSLALTIWSAPLTDIAGGARGELAVADAYLAIDDIGWFLFGASRRRRCDDGDPCLARGAGGRPRRRWLGWVGVALGVASLATIAFFGVFAWMAWIAGASIVMLGGRR